MFSVAYRYIICCVRLLTPRRIERAKVFLEALSRRTERFLEKDFQTKEEANSYYGDLKEEIFDEIGHGGISPGCTCNECVATLIYYLRDDINTAKKFIEKFGEKDFIFSKDRQQSIDYSLI